MCNLREEESVFLFLNNRKKDVTYFCCDTVSSGWIQLTDFSGCTSFPGHFKSGHGHSCFDQAGADSVDADIGPLQLPGRGLSK